MYDSGAGIVGLCSFLILFLSLIAIFFGILLLIQKQRYLKNLAIFLLLSGVTNIYTNSSFFVARMGVEVLAKYGYLGLLIVLIKFLSIIFLFLYAREKYNSEGLALVLILPPVWFILFKAAQVAVLRSTMGIDLIKNRILYASFISLGDLATIIVMIYIAVIYYHNKDREHIFPLIWVFTVLFAVLSVLNAATSILVQFPSCILPAFLIRIIIAAAYPAFGIYLLVNSSSEITG